MLFRIVSAARAGHMSHSHEVRVCNVARPTANFLQQRRFSCGRVRRRDAARLRHRVGARAARADGEARRRRLERLAARKSRLQGHDGRVNALAAALDDCKLFAATTQRIVCYDLHNGAILETLECGEQLPVSALKLSADSTFLFAGCGRRVHVHDVRTIDSRRPTFSGDEGDGDGVSGALCCIAMSRDERTAACGTCDG